MIYKLRPMVRFSRAEEGVFFQHRDNSLIVEGSSALYEFFYFMRNALEKGIERESLLASVPPANREAAEYLINRLIDHNMLLSIEQMTIPHISEGDRNLFDTTINYLESTCENPYDAFKQFRNARILALGSGLSYLNMVRTLAAMGLGQLVCWAAEKQDNSQLLRLSRTLEYYESLHHEIRTENDIGQIVSQEDWTLILYAEDTVETWTIEYMEGLTRSSGISILQAVTTQGVGVLGSSTGDDDSSFLEAVRRVDFASVRASQNREPPESSTLSESLAPTVGNFLALEAFNFVTGLGCRIIGNSIGTICQDTLLPVFRTLDRTLEATDTNIPVSRVLETFESAGQPPSVEQFLEGIVGLTDELLGYLPAPAPHNLLQAPLNTFATCILTTHPVNRRVKSRQVIGFGRGQIEARYNAVVEGIKGLIQSTMYHKYKLRAVPLGSEKYVREIAVDKTRLVLSAGLGYEDWLANGLQRSLADHFLTQGIEHLSVNPSFDMISFANRRISIWWDLLTYFSDRHISIEVLTSPELPEFYLGIVVEGEEVLSSGYGVVDEDAVLNAMMNWVARAQLSHDGVLDSEIRVFGSLASENHDVTTPEEPPHAYSRQVPKPGWLNEMLASLSRIGCTVVASPFHSDELVRKHGLLVGWVGILPNE